MERSMATPIHDPTVHLRPSCTQFTTEALRARPAPGFWQRLLRRFGAPRLDVTTLSSSTARG